MNGKEFNEDLRHPEANDSTGFAWNELYDSLGEGEEIVGKDRYAAFGYALCRVLDFILGKDLSDTKKIGMRAVALAWVVNPSLVDGVSLGRLSKTLGLSNIKSVSILTSEVRRVFGVCNPMQLVRGGQFRADDSTPKATRKRSDDDEQADLFTGDAIPLAA